MTSAFEYMTELMAKGTNHFTTEQAVAALGGSLSKVRAELRRLKAEGAVVDPHRSFHVIVPADRRACGCPAPEELVPPLMQHLHESYYVALLSAAEAYGGHPQDHPFQVMTKVPRKSIECGEVHLQLLGRKDLARTPLFEKATARGALPIASPEATALELVGYVNQCGGLESIAAVLADIVDTLDPERLIALAPSAPIAWTQRLGYLLDATDNRALADGLTPIVKALAHHFAPLVRARSKAGARRVARWKLAVNAAL